MDILILHGWNLSGRHYRGIARLLKSDGHRVFTPDLPGFGSRKPLHHGALTLSSYADFVREYIKKEKIASAVVIGHSFGGRIALRLAAEDKKFASKLILTGVPGVREAGVKRRIFLFLSKVGGGVFSFPIVKRVRERARTLLYSAAREKDYYRASGALRDTLKNVVSEDLIPHIKQISNRVVLVWGRNDTITPISVAQKMKNILPDAQLIVIPKAGHSSIISDPAVFYRHAQLNIL